MDTLGKPTPYDFGLKAHFESIDPIFDNTPADNPTTNQGVELGRFLFYDKRLSKNNTISCASCHRQENAFSDPDRFSLGFEGGRTGRNSMSIVNMRWQRLFFWDGRAPTLEEQVLMPIQDHIEMGMTLDGLESKLRDIDLYPPMFEKAFGDKEIHRERISKALAQFVRTIVSQHSKFDDLYGLPESRIKAQLSEKEYLGYRLFTTHVDPDYGSGKNEPGTIFRGANCGDCHKTQLLTNNLITSNGLDSVTKDPGYGKVSGLAKYDGTFKTPTLRNVALTAPYMHDGRFATLREVIAHYDQHVKPHPNLDYQIGEAGNTLPGRLDLTEDEIDALLAFLETLTDHELIKDPRYADPFE
ncbi:MAG: c-type cytochrome [Bacteroidetes bacterium]|nr:c-type cytochrome [Bacteroidota bacterium]